MNKLSEEEKSAARRAIDQLRDLAEKLKVPAALQLIETFARYFATS
jgi:hypothetical protein